MYAHFYAGQYKHMRPMGDKVQQTKRDKRPARLSLVIRFLFVCAVMRNGKRSRAKHDRDYDGYSPATKTQELSGAENGVRRNSPRWTFEVEEAIRMAKEIYDKVPRQSS